jgi:hypothetical protein
MKKPEFDGAIEALPPRFAEHYRSPEWKALNPVARAELIMVAEGAKPGLITFGFKGAGFRVAQEFAVGNGMRFDSISDEDEEGESHVTCTIGRPEAFQALAAWSFRERVQDFLGIGRGDFVRKRGEFLGYPKCCIEAFIESGRNPEIIRIPNCDGVYAEELDYCPPCFVPCGEQCEKALGTLRGWKKAVEAADPEAAQELRALNRRRFDPRHRLSPIKLTYFD